MRYLFLFSILSSLLLSACLSIPQPKQRIANTQQLASQAGWQFNTIDTSSFKLASFAPSHLKNTHHLTIYIEGDGLAWITKTTISRNPTPINPMALKLALSDPSKKAIYLGRVCQYIKQPDGLCRKKYWTSHRFSPQVIEASNQAISLLKQQYSAQTLTLVGYSGGAAIATLVAAKRHDVVKIITIAGNLNHPHWTKTLKISPLMGSLNPADFAQQLRHIPQIHFVGQNDKIISPSMVKTYTDKLNNPNTVHTRIIAGFTHHCCWDRDWTWLLKTIQ